MDRDTRAMRVPYDLQYLSLERDFRAGHERPWQRQRGDPIGDPFAMRFDQAAGARFGNARRQRQANLPSRSVDAQRGAPGAGRADDHERQRTAADLQPFLRSEEHTSELQSLMRISYAVFCL